MRNVLVALVLSCIGLSCGFIVPSGIRELIADLKTSANSIQNSDSKARNMIKSKILNISLVNPTVTSELLTNSMEIHYNSTNNSLDKDLYENSNGKNATIEERSFIYIKQRSKTPYLKNLFEIIPRTKFENEAVKSHVLNHPILDEISRRFVTENIDNKYFKPRDGPSNLDKYQSKTHNFINYHIDAERKKQMEKITTKQDKHFELIKAPLPRPIVKTNEKDFINMENSLFNFTIGRKLLTDIQESLATKIDIKLNYDGQLEDNSTNINYDKGVTVNDETFDNDNLDQTVKQVIENQISERKPNQIDHNSYNFCRDRLKKLEKLSLKSHQQSNRHNCKCGRKGLLKILGDDIVN